MLGQDAAQWREDGAHWEVSGGEEVVQERVESEGDPKQPSNTAPN